MKSKSPKITNSQTPEMVLREFINDLEYLIHSTKDWVVILRESKKQVEKLEAINQIHVETTAILNYINSILDYVRERADADSDETILSRIANELRHPMTTIEGFSKLYQESTTSRERKQEIENLLLQSIKNIEKGFVRFRNKYSRLG